jgi:hypothetical protein
MKNSGGINMANSAMKRILHANGAYGTEKEADNKYIGIYLKSPVVYEERKGKAIRSTVENRAFADVEFVLSEAESGEWIVAELNVPAINQQGVNEFVVAMLTYGLTPETEERIVSILERLLEQSNAPWGQLRD